MTNPFIPRTHTEWVWFIRAMTTTEAPTQPPQVYAALAKHLEELGAALAKAQLELEHVRYDLGLEDPR